MHIKKPLLCVKCKIIFIYIHFVSTKHISNSFKIDIALIVYMVSWSNEADSSERNIHLIHMFIAYRYFYVALITFW